MSRHAEVAAKVLAAVDACRAAHDALGDALISGAQLGVPVPGFWQLQNGRAALAEVINPHGAAVVLATAEAQNRKASTG